MLMVEFAVVSNIIQVYKWWVQIYVKGIPVGAEYCSDRLFCELIFFGNMTWFGVILKIINNSCWL
jgi:hypothetical protein